MDIFYLQPNPLIPVTNKSQQSSSEISEHFPFFDSAGWQLFIAAWQAII